MAQCVRIGLAPQNICFWRRLGLLVRPIALLPSTYDGHLNGRFPNTHGQKRSVSNPPHSSTTATPPTVFKAVIRVAADDRTMSDFGSLCQEQRVLHVDTKIAHGVLDLGVSEKYLDGADVARRLVDHGRLRATERMCTMILRA